MSIRAFVCVLLFWCVSSTCVAVDRRRLAVVEDSVPSLVRDYVDSLLQYKQRMSGIEESLSMAPNPKYYRLFVPLTFYHDISHELFDLNVAPSLAEGELRRSLLAVYLERPDLVRSTESALASELSTVEPETQTNANVLSDATPVQSVDEVKEPEPMPVDIVVKRPNFWSFGADTYLQILQNYVSTNWYKGGQSNYSVLSTVTLQANYNNKQKVKWDNKLEMKLGFQTSRDDTVHSVKTSEDLLRYTGKFGLQATKHWYYTLQTVAQSQFSRMYKSNSHVVTADFFAPIQVNVSLGMDYSMDFLKGRLKGTVHLAPFAYNMKYVNREYLASRYGIDEGRKVKNDYGSQIVMDMTWNVTDNIRWKSRIYGYTTYERTEFQAENTFSFQFSKYISTNVFVHPRFDDSTSRDDHHGYWQYKEYASFGFTYSF